MNKRRIDIISKYFTPANAGIEVNILETYKVLASTWDITMHTSTDTLKEIDVLPATDVVENIQVKRYKFGKLGYFPQIYWAKADLVCLHNFNVFFFPILVWLKIKKLQGYKFTVVVTPHGGFNPEWSVFPKLQGTLKYWYHKTVGTFCLNTVVDKIRAVSLWEKRSMVEMGVNPKKISVITNGLENDAFKDIEKLASSDVKKKVKSYGKYLIQIGRVYPIKNYETVIKALAQLPKDVKYLIVGEEEKNNHYSGYKQQLIELARTLGVEKRVIFTGQVRGVDKYYLIKHAQMMVHMALWESFCNVVHEGMSQGLVCVVANNTALPLLIKDGVNGYCVETMDSVMLANKINYILDNKQSAKIKQIEERNRKLGLEVSWTQVAGKMDTFYREENL
jgi:glycosyltransferase involved in cell wall biosynthesis